MHEHSLCCEMLEVHKLRAYLHGEKLSLVGGLPYFPGHLLPSVYMKKLSLFTEPKLGPLGFAHALYVPTCPW